MRRVPEVIDCWFDSGAMPVAQWHYPFENDAIFEDGRFPADYICEAVDQTRGWFYSLHAISTLLFNRPCFMNVICLGHILDAKGEKMSKAKGNVVEPEAVIDKYGADALRWYCLTATAPGNVRRFSEDAVAEATRRFLLTLWNVYSFFVTYANIDDFVPGAEKAPSPESELDRWIISELNQLVVDVETALDGYDPTGAGRKIESFVNDLSNWYVRRSRRRFWKSENDADKQSAYATLYECLVTLLKLLAPLTPFLAEELYQNLVRSVFPDAPDSVHLADFPVADVSRIDKQLSDDTRLAMKISSLGRAARGFAGIKVRQPLSEVIVNGATSRQQAGLKRLQEQIREELNVKELSFATITGQIMALDVDLTGTKAAEVKVGYIGSPPVGVNRGYLVVSEAGYKVAVPYPPTEELEKEGMAREIVRRIQTMRRSTGFDIADHIITYYKGDEYIRQVLENEDLANYIKQETLSRQLVEGVTEEGVFTESYKLAGHDILLGVKKLS
jgi:isoleucyl-tRNA synthetase